MDEQKGSTHRAMTAGSSGRGGAGEGALEDEEELEPDAEVGFGEEGDELEGEGGLEGEDEDALEEVGEVALEAEGRAMLEGEGKGACGPE